MGCRHLVMPSCRSDRTRRILEIAECIMAVDVVARGLLGDERGEIDQRHGRAAFDQILGVGHALGRHAVGVGDEEHEGLRLALRVRARGCRR